MFDQTQGRPAEKRLVSDHAYRVLGMLAEVKLFLILLVAPLFMGGRHPLGIEVFVGCCCCYAVVCALRQWIRPISRKVSIADFVLVLGVLLLLVQIVPLPDTLLKWLAPSQVASLPLWQEEAGSGLGKWETISLAPNLTRQSLVLFASYGLLFFGASMHLKDMQTVKRTFKIQAYGYTAIALFGIMQAALGNGKFFWFYEAPFRVAGHEAQGPFTNPNHFAHFLALAIGPLLWLLIFPDEANEGQSHRRSSRRPARTDYLNYRVLLLSCVVLLLTAGMLSHSRGGFLVHAIALTSGVSAAMFISKRIRLGLGILCGVILVSGIMVYHAGHGKLVEELETVSLASIEQWNESAGRQVPWDASLKAFPNYWLVGSGGGSFREVYKLHSDHFSPYEVTHAECGYLQLAVETGLAGISLLVAALLVVLMWLGTAMKSPRRTLLVAIVPGLLISLLHSLVDFVWYIPACLTGTLVLLVGLYRTAHGDAKELQLGTVVQRKTLAAYRNFVMPFVTMSLVCVSIWSMNTAYRQARGWAAWETYLSRTGLSQALDVAESEPKKISATLASVSSVDRGDTTAPDKLSPLETSIAQLRQCVRLNPSNSRARLRLSEALLHHFEVEQQQAFPGLGLVAIADAVRVSAYVRDAEVREWLSQATQERHALLYEAYDHTLHAVRQQPMAGEGYVLLAQLGFLHPSKNWNAEELLEQALLVRPYDGEVLFAAAAVSQLEFEPERTFGLLAQAIRRDPKIRKLVVQQIGPQLTVTQFVELLEPDRPTFIELVQFYRGFELTDEAILCAQLYLELVDQEVQKAKTSVQKAAICKEAGWLCASLGFLESAVHYERKSLEYSPKDFELHLRFARKLVKLGEDQEAAVHFRWCLARRPSPELKEELRALLLR